ncbi:glucose-1-phosphate thymidylyltransferase [Streptomyces albus]|uniref:glucose-1-phosphate thymidylyltransferase n=1 Tax=Streptomyces albus TaxID=1888 RepID=UPI003F1C2F80
MKALVLSGGRGTRLRPFSHTLAKQLIPVANEPVLFHALRSIRQAGITDIGVVTGEAGEEIRGAVGDGAQFDCAITCIRQSAPLGLAHAVTSARDFLGDESFLLYLGDNYIDEGIGRLVETFRVSGSAAELLLSRVADPRSYGVAECDDTGRVVRVVEKPRSPASDLAMLGAYVFSPEVHERIARLSPSWRGELEITDAVQGLIDVGARVGSTVVDTYWRDTGSVADVLDVNRHLLERTRALCAGWVDDSTEVIGRVVIEEGAKVRGSRLVGPLIVGRNTQVTGAWVGPYTSIGENCTVADSELDFSVLLDGAEVTGLSRITASVIGRGSTVGTASLPRAHQVVIGDHSSLWINT